MKPPIFDYHSPSSVDEALNLARRLGADAKFIAGGQSLVPMMNFRLVRPAHLIDLNGIDGLAYLRVENGELCIGAMTRHRDVEHSEIVRNGWPLISECMPHVAHVQIRNRGTLGGSLSHADPAAELPAVMTALDAKMVLRSSRGTRTVPAGGFFVSSLLTVAEPGELLTEVRVPSIAPATGWAFDEFNRRRGDFAIVGAAALVRLDKAGTIEWSRLVFTGVGEKPVRSRAVESALKGQARTEAVLQAAAEQAGAKLSPESDLHASAGYRRDVAKVLALRMLTKAVERSRTGVQ
ncbi:MAG: xanthine dehydrogenase family protein subunit M [Xanthobacteraceae bacterium]